MDKDIPIYKRVKLCDKPQVLGFKTDSLKSQAEQARVISRLNERVGGRPSDSVKKRPKRYFEGKLDSNLVRIEPQPSTQEIQNQIDFVSFNTKGNEDEEQ